MTDAELWTAWQFWMAVATVIVLAAAALLIAIWVVAQRILGEALRALDAARTIRRQTQAIWQLQATNESTAALLATVKSIEAKATALAGALEGHAADRR
jgi:hypothetical protein